MSQNQQVLRLTGHFKLSQRVAGKLVRAGFYTPKLIKAASDEELLAITSIKQEDVDEIRVKINRV